jgi:hypothetical protein
MHLLSGTLSLLQTPLNWKEFKATALCYTRFFNGVCDYKYEDILVRLNFLMLHLRRRHLDALFLINVFKGKISCSSVFDTVSLRIPTRSVRDYYTFTQSQSHISTDGQSASLSWCRAPFGTHDQMLSLRSDRYSMSRLVASSLTKGRVCHLSWSLSDLYIFTFATVQIYIHNINSTMNNIYRVYVSPGTVQQIMHLSSIML